MTRSLARRAGLLLAAIGGLLLTAAGAVSGAQTLGHRNGHSLVVNPETGELWMTEQGPSGGDEGEVPRSGQLQRVVFNEKWEEIRREPLLRELKQRIRDVRQGPDGLLYVLTSENPGAVLRLEPIEATTAR